MECNSENSLKETAGDVKEIIKNCKKFIDKSSQHRYIQKTQSPKIECLIKLHKGTQYVRPVVNYKNVPTYKIAKL